jgi:hypothetical protein
MGKSSTRVLPCTHEARIVAQVEPARALLEGLDEAAPGLLQSHGVSPEDYRHSQVFRTAVESIRGRFAANMTAPRQRFVSDVLAVMRAKGLIAGFEPAHQTERWDFQVAIAGSPQRIGTIEVKGGEGNSLNISERWPYTQEFVVWCHLDGAIQNDPSVSARAIIGRLVADIVKRKKQIDALIIRDRLCGTRLRPCPKYASEDAYPELGPAPDVFLFPQQVPDLVKNPKPAGHTEDTCALPFRVLDAFGVRKRDRGKHIWNVSIAVGSETQRDEQVVTRRVCVSQGDAVMFEHTKRM